jgi:Lysozyme like domain
MATVLRMVADLQAGNMAKTVEVLQRQADHLGNTLGGYEARIKDKAAQASLLKLEDRADKLNRKLDTELTIGGTRKAAAELLAVEAAADRLNAKLDRSSLATRIAGSGLLKPSWLGTGIALTPALIPAAAGAAGAIGAVTAAFGAAALAAGGFGLMASNVLSSASEDAKKLAALNLQLNSATTASAKAAVRAQINALQQGWTPAYRQVMANLTTLKTAWKSVSIAVAAPAVAQWLKVVLDGLKFIKPLVQPVADEFLAWGQALDRYFKSSAGARTIHDIANNVGQFAAGQLGDIVQFMLNLGKGLWRLGGYAKGALPSIGSVGTHLATWGQDFQQWTKSKKARDDVHALLKFMSDNSHTLATLAKNLARDLPGIFAGMSAVGTAEIKALSAFLGWVAKLPPSWSKPLTEAAGALYLLSKTGVLRIGLKIVSPVLRWLTGGVISLGGGEAAAAAIRAAFTSGGAAAAAEIRAAMTGGAVSGAEGAAAGGAAAGIGTKALWARMFLRGGLALGLGVAITQALGQIGRVLPKGGAAGIPGWAQGLGGFLWGGRQNYVNLTDSFQKYVQAPIRHGLASVAHDFWTSGQSISGVESRLWAGPHGITETTKNGADSVAAKIRIMKDNAQSDFDATRHQVTGIWDNMWNAAHSRTKTGVNDVSGQFNTAKTNVLTHMGAMEKGVGTDAAKIQDHLNKLHSVHRKVALDLQLPKGVSLGHKVTVGFAQGTSGAPPGWAWVGEKGPELIRMTGGETVIPTHRLPGFAEGVVNLSTQIPVAPQIAKIAAFQRVINAIAAAAAEAAKVSPSVLGRLGLGRPGTSAGGRFNLGMLENLWQQAGGPGGYIAHIAGAIALAESGGNPRARNPSGASGLWQILGQVVAGNIFNPFVNALNAVKKYDDARGFSPWVTFTNGAYLGFMGNGFSGIVNGPAFIGVGERGPEYVSVTPAGKAGSGHDHKIEVKLVVGTRLGPTALDRAVVDIIRKYVRVTGGGDVETAFNEGW